MESELSGIFFFFLVTKNIVRGSPGTQFMHMRVKRDSYTGAFPWILWNFQEHLFWETSVNGYLNISLHEQITTIGSEEDIFSKAKQKTILKFS